MKTIFTFSILCLLTLISFSSQGQDFYFNNSENINTVGESDLIGPMSSASNYIVNKTTKSVKVNWEKIVNDLPEDWAVSVCDAELCYGSDITTGSFDVAPGDSALMKVQFETAGVSGLASIELYVYAATDSAALNASASFSGEIWSVGNEELEVVREWRAYPNPTVNELSVALNNYDEVRSIEVYNMVGKLVQVFQVDDPTAIQKLDVIDLEEGMYFISLLSEDGQLVETKRFSKIH